MRYLAPLTLLALLVAPPSATARPTGTTNEPKPKYVLAEKVEDAIGTRTLCVCSDTDDKKNAVPGVLEVQVPGQSDVAPKVTCKIKFDYFKGPNDEASSTGYCRNYEVIGKLKNGVTLY